MSARETVTSSEAAAICDMDLNSWRITASRSAKGRVDPPQPIPVGADTTAPGRPYLYDRAEVEAWAKVRRRRGRATAANATHEVKRNQSPRTHREWRHL